MQYVVAPRREQLQEYYYRSLTREENIVAVITQDRVIDGNLKSQVKGNTQFVQKVTF